MDDRQKAMRQEIRSLLAEASHEQLVQAILRTLDATEEAQRPLDYGDYGVGGWRDHEAVTGERNARVGVAEDVEESIHASLIA